SIATQEVKDLGGVMEGVKDTFRHWWLVIRCSALGTFTAIIPGMGAATTQWLAYAHAVQSSPNRERFGKGAVEGVLGPGAANNSTLGGSLVTTIAFGVPASVTMAILMGAFLIQGLVPGPAMRTPARKGHLAAPAAPARARAGPARREQALPVHRQLRPRLALAPGRASPPRRRRRGSPGTHADRAPAARENTRRRGGSARGGAGDAASRAVARRGDPVEPLSCCPVRVGALA